MSNETNISLLSAYELHRLIAKRELSPVEVIDAALAQIEKHNGALNAIVAQSDTIREEAKAAEELVAKGGDLPLLIGLPAGIKDVTPVGGVRTTYGSPLYADHVPGEDALVVRRLREAGAIIIGKTNTPEFATGGNTFNEVYGRTLNPWDTKMSAGGSTGGGAVGLATGMIALAEGTDLGGSLRIPASFCGILGLRPSPGLVPTYPSEFMWDNMQVTGIMGRKAEDVALALQAIAGIDPASPVGVVVGNRDFIGTVNAGPAKTLRVAYCPDIAGIGVDPGVEKVCRDAAFALRDSGVTVDEIEFDLSYGWDPFLAIRGQWMVAQQYARLEHLQEFGDNLRKNVEAGIGTSMEKYGAAEQARGRVWTDFYQFFQKYDHLLTPTMAVPPFPASDNYPEEIAGKKMKTHIDWVAPTFLLSLTGLPVGSVPCGRDANGMPVGIQVVGPQLGEEKVLALAKRMQDQRPIGLPDLDGGAS